jgi:ATP-dependent DNA ligase
LWHFIAAFDLLHLDGVDLRRHTLLERKTELRQFVAPGGPDMYVDHVAHHGRALFEEICRRDLEGINAKWARGPYDPDAARWYKKKNPAYSPNDRAMGNASAAAGRGGRITPIIPAALLGHARRTESSAFAPLPAGFFRALGIQQFSRYITTSISERSFKDACGY